MDREVKLGFRLLASLAIVGFQCVTNSVAAVERGELYVISESSDCTNTRLTMSLEEVKALPSVVLLTIKLRTLSPEGTKTIVQAKELSVHEGKYVWTGVIGFGKFTALLYDRKRNLLGETAFSNERLVQKLSLDKRLSIVQLRQGDVVGARKPSAGLQADGIVIRGIRFAPATRLLHIILINAKGELSDQYLGQPKGSWKSKPLPPGVYKQVIVEYSDEGRCSFLGLQ